MIKRLKYTLLFTGFMLALQAQTFAAPSLSNVSGSFVNGGSITINGTGFGADGPNIVVFDDFESGTSGSSVTTTGPEVGNWNSVPAAAAPKYDNSYSVSGTNAAAMDYSIKTSSGTDSSPQLLLTNLNAQDIFLAYWVYVPVGVSFPCYSHSDCNWKPAWFYGTNSGHADVILPRGLGPVSNNSSPLSDWGVTCNGCASPQEINFSWSMKKGKWYRIWSWVHGTVSPDTSGKKQLWISSVDDNMAVTKKIDVTQAIFPDTTNNQFLTFSFGGWGRWCSVSNNPDCADARIRFDDAYVATGINARARIELGDAPTYATCKNLTIATVSSWSDNSISATIRQGSFLNVNNAYIYIFDASGNVNQSGYALCPKCPRPPVLH